MNILIERATNNDNSLKTIRDVLNKITDAFKIEPNLEKDIQIHLGQIVSQLYRSALDNTEGYCYKFSLPLAAVQSIFKKLNIDPRKIEEAFRYDWKYPPKTHMYADSYYHILLLLILYGLKFNNRVFANNSLLLMLVKMWNGRRQDFFPFCNPATMKYVIQNMLSNKFLTSKYDSPLQLISNYFVPTILQSYGEKVKTEDPNELKRLFSQAYSRVYQIFWQQPKINPETGKKEATGGLSALYYRAHNEGASSRDVRVYADEDGETTFDQYGSSHAINEIVNTVTDYIVLNKQYTYPEGFIKQLNRLTHVANKVINNLAIDIHSSEYYDLIRDILILILGRLNVIQKTDICSTQFILDIKKKIISSKNNSDSKKIASLIDTLLIKLFNKRNLKLERYSIVQRIQIRTVIIHIIIFNLKKVICHQHATQQLSFLSKLKITDII